MDIRPRHARQRVGNGALGGFLQRGVERCLHADVAVLRRLDAAARLWQDPVSEVRAARQRLAAALDLGHIGIGRPSLGDRAVGDHRREDDALAGLCGGEMAARREARRGLHQTGEHRRLPEGQLARLDVEVGPRGGAQAVRAVAEIDARQVAAEDLFLAQPALEVKGDDNFLQLAPDRPVAGQEACLGELLRQRRSALGHAAGFGVAEQRAGDALRIDPPVVVEAPVLDRDDRGGDIGRQLGDRDGSLFVVAAPCDRRAAGVEQDKARVLERLERAAERCGDHEPDAERNDRQDDQGENRLPPATNEAAAGGWRRRVVGSEQRVDPSTARRVLFGVERRHARSRVAVKRTPVSRWAV